MPYGTPVDPVAGTVITVAYAVTNLLDPIRALRSFTGGADPPGSNYWLRSTSSTATGWFDRAAEVLAAIGYTPVNRAGDTMTGKLAISLNQAADVGLSIRNQHANGFGLGIFNAAASAFDLLVTHTSAEFTVPIDGTTATLDTLTATAVEADHITALNNHLSQPTLSVRNQHASGPSAVVYNAAASAFDLFMDHAAANFGIPVQGTQLRSTVATGTAPLTVNSTTKVTNLDADTVDGKHALDLSPTGMVAWFETAAELTAAGASWARYTAADGRLLIGAGTTFSQTFTEATNYGSNWTPSSGLGVSDTVSWSSSAVAASGTAGTNFQNGAGVPISLDSLGHTHPAPTLSKSGSVSLTGTGTAWLPPSRAGIWGRRI